MDFSLTPQQRKLVEGVRGFVEAECTEENLAIWVRDEGLPGDVLRRFVKSDFCGFPVVSPDADDRLSLTAQALVLEELAHASGATLPLMNDFLNLHLVKAFMPSYRADRAYEAYLRKGRLDFAFAISEPSSGSETKNMSTRVTREGGRLLLNGSKTYAFNAEYAPNLFIAALEQGARPSLPPRLSLWLFPANLPGVEVYPIQKMGQPMLPYADIEFRDVELSDQYRVTSTDAAGVSFPLLYQVFDCARLFDCATALGLAQSAMDQAAAFAIGHEAFGESIGSFQMIQEKLVDMEVSLQNMRAMVYRTAQVLDETPLGGATTDSRLTTALMKRYVPKAATQVASEALQIFGGRGYMRTSKVSGIWEDCRGFQISVGTDEVMVYAAAPLLARRYAN